MLKKIPLHWQILAGLVLAVVFGVVFPDRYRIDDDFFKALEKKEYAWSVDAQYLFGGMAGRSLTQKEFLKVLESRYTVSELKQTTPHFLEAARYNRAIRYIDWIGELFMRALKMLIVPLVLSSIVSGVAGIGSAAGLGRITAKTLGFYILSSLVAIVTGLGLVLLIKPGMGMGLTAVQSASDLAGMSTFRDTLIGIIPDNIFAAFTSANMLSIIFFAMVTGFFITQLRDDYREKLLFMFTAFSELMLKMTLWVIRFAPLGVFALVAGVVAGHSDLAGLAENLGLYFVTVMLALAIHGLITLPLTIRLLARVNPVKHFRALRVVLLTAFSTSSSGATLPLTMEAVEHKCGVSNKIASFTLPLGATINMNGTALYECIAVIFIANAYGIDLSFGQQVIVVITSLLAAIGAAAVPMAGLVMMTIILTAVGLPLEGIGLILTVDRILDMFRTTINVLGDTCGAVIVAKSEGEKLPQ
ncbi:MAG TPA: dicarboxylate/amino acid:cation symporter [Bacteroidales bacterium]|nr:dicarboxylate/amino acid:cation symporter [Bacteroidales bacterium]HRZ50333.1 dicarboxylate/amino acid:cation symporter [Bacteroidales bacterium]